MAIHGPTKGDNRYRTSNPFPAASKRCRGEGIRLGPEPKLSEHRRQEVSDRAEAGESATTITKSFRVHHATVLGSVS